MATKTTATTREQTAQARQVFDNIIATETDLGKIALLELLREYYTNSEFRAALHDYVWMVNQGDA